MKLGRDLLIYAILVGLSVLLAHWPSYWLAFSDYASCSELGCGILATFVFWPILSLVIFVALILLRSRLRRHSEAP